MLGKKKKKGVTSLFIISKIMGMNACWSGPCASLHRTPTDSKITPVAEPGHTNTLY